MGLYTRLKRPPSQNWKERNRMDGLLVKGGRVQETTAFSFLLSKIIHIFSFAFAIDNLYSAFPWVVFTKPLKPEKKKYK
jgi:hypothetical protein